MDPLIPRDSAVAILAQMQMAQMQAAAILQVEATAIPAALPMIAQMDTVDR